MTDLHYDTEDRICALATPWASSALAIIRLTGKDCLKELETFFSKPEVLQTTGGGRSMPGYLLALSKEPVDEVVLTVWRGPHSYTGQDCAEITCHGSLAVIRRILDELTRKAFRPAGPGEFTLRAFLNGKLDLTRAEAVAEIVAAKTDSARALAVHRLAGAIENRVKEIRHRLLDLAAIFNIQLDYAEDEVDVVQVPLDLVHEIKADIENLASTFRTGQIMQEGLRIVLAGRTNAGKSSLFNMLLKEDRSIVSSEHGTTRDFIEAWISLGELPVRIYDTAGLREAEAFVEIEGIRRTKELINTADLVFYLVDATDKKPDPEDLTFLEKFSLDHPHTPLIRLWTKLDSEQAQPSPPGWLGISSLTGVGYTELAEQVRRLLLDRHPLVPGTPVIDSLRQKELLDRAGTALNAVIHGKQRKLPLDLLALDVHDALQALGEIVGEVTSADLLNHMFGNFCVGK